MEPSYEMINDSSGAGSPMSATSARTLPDDNEFMVPLLSTPFDEASNVQFIHRNEENPNVQVATRGMKQIVEGVQELVNSVPQQDLSDSEKEHLRDGLLKVASGLSDTILGMEYLAATEDQARPPSAPSLPPDSTTPEGKAAAAGLDFEPNISGMGNIVEGAAAIVASPQRPWYRPANILYASLIMFSVASVAGSVCIFGLGLIACGMNFL